MYAHSNERRRRELLGDMLTELDNEILFDILQQDEHYVKKNARDDVQSDTDKRNQAPSSDPFCKDKANGNYVNPFECEGFIMCSNHLTYFFDCPSDLTYNAKTDRCDWPRNVKCGPTQKPTMKPTRPSPTPSKSTFCKNKPNGNYVDPNNCEGFIMCSNHLTYFFDCPSNLRYNAKTDQCDWPWNVQCGPTPVPTKKPVPSPTPSKSTFCKNKPNGNYVDPNNCEGFIMCSNHLTYFFDCPADLRYNAKTDRCDWPWNVKCGPTPVPTTKTPVPSPTPSKSTFCKNKPNGNYVDPNNCEGFIMCSNHLTYFFDCPANLRYNAKTDRCDWPWNVKCGPTPVPTTKKPIPSPTPSKSTFCKNKPNGNYVDPNNCEGFIMCSNHLTYFFDCPANLRYNAKTDRCDWPRNVKCPPKSMSDDALKTAKRKKSPFCMRHGNGNYRDITNCEGYFTCYFGYQIFRECPGYLRFNPETRRCDLPRNVKCAGAGGGTRGSGFCKKRKNGDYRDVLNCNDFIKCSNGYTYYFDCPSILRFNERTDRCDWPRNVRCPY
ncbi:hypothetical protein QZH41_000371 [Actinostola sp. cb2023]|nr:hypothetical protein QZH41_000371 [Actinostola sp. cb2023]